MIGLSVNATQRDEANGKVYEALLIKNALTYKLETMIEDMRNLEPIPEHGNDFIADVISLNEAKKVKNHLVSKNGLAGIINADYAYIKPQCIIAPHDDLYNKSQEYKLIDRNELIRYYKYSFMSDRFYYAYTYSQLNDLGINLDDL